MSNQIWREFRKLLTLTCMMALTVELTRPAVAHDMFLVVPDHELPAQTEITIALFNGTFEESLNTIDRGRMLDVSVVDGRGDVLHPAAAQWRDEGNVTLLNLTTGPPGTYTVGVSTDSRIIELSAAEFNEYLSHDGVLDVLRAREQKGTLGAPAKERYSKHVKTILQVGNRVTDAHSYLLGYPIEFVPQTNPANLKVGDTLRVLVLAEGAPAADQLVYASYDGYHDHDGAGKQAEAISTRTDDTGVAEIEIAHRGRWYLRLIRMLPVEDADVDYESNWATLTFEVE